MMVEFKWISLFLPAVLQFTAAAGKLPLSFTVRFGDEVTLPCENVIHGQQQCECIRWIFSGSGSTALVELVKFGQIGENAKDKSDRLSVTENCSLVIKKVTDEDVGYYGCRQINKSEEVKYSLVHLSVITMTERKDADKVTLNCSVSTSGWCSHTVKWLYEGKDVDKDMKTSQSDCYATVSFLDSHFSYKSKSNLKCEVTDIYSGKVQLFTFSPQSSGDTQTTTTTTTPAITKPATTQPTTTKSTTTENTKSTTNDTSTKLQESFWRFIVVSVGLAALIIIVVAVNIWTRTKGTKTQMDENTVNNDEDEDDGVVNYENDGDPSASVRLH